MEKRQYCLVLFLTITALCHCVYGQSVKEILEKGDRLFAKKDFENALKLYLDAINIDPNDAKANFRVGISYLHGEKKARAVPYLQKAYRTNPEEDEDID